MKKVDNKKILVLLSFFSLLLVGVTIAYYYNKTTLSNEFNLSDYDVVATETFTSPNNWKPGDSVDKSVTVTNNGTVNAAVRACLKERWFNEAGVAQGRAAAVSFDTNARVLINNDNENDWIRVDNCYYYVDPLEPGETTSSFMKSITFNPDFGEDLDCEQVGNVETCVSDTHNLNGGRYELYITTETLQYSMYKDVWNTSVVIEDSNNPIRFINKESPDTITQGDIVRIGGTEDFYVVSSNENETVLLAKYNLLVGRIYTDPQNYTEIPISTEGYGLQNSTAKGFKSNSESSVGPVAFSNENYWHGKVGEGLDYPGSYNDSNFPNVYDEDSIIYEYINDYKEYLEGEGITIKKARLLTYQEAITLGCEGAPDYSCLQAPSWLSDTSYWLGSSYEYYTNADDYIWYIYSGNSRILYSYHTYSSSYGVRPVIVINTSDLLNSTTSIPDPVSFATDNWDTIKKAVKKGNTNVYHVGDTKDIQMDLNNDGIMETYTLRIANNSTPSICSTEGFSQTACGFVIEFKDIITDHRMNPYTDGSTNGEGNRGGWEYSEMRSFVNNDIYNKLPSDLKNKIINTKVVSGHGSSDSNNFITTDKLYLLSSVEVWGTPFLDLVTASNPALTRQLDYYETQGVSQSNYEGAKKNGTNSLWFLRSAIYNDNFKFSVVNGGEMYGNGAISSNGVSPAFRIG